MRALGAGVALCWAAEFALLPAAAAPEADIPRPEHPRPDFRRARWLNLNGTWRFALADRVSDDPGAIAFERQIVVPFGWQSRLSGVGLARDGVGWYQRAITVPPQWRGQRVFLLFGAVDQEATVWLDGQRLGENRVVYAPFEFELTERIRWSRRQTLTVRAVDFGSRAYPKGKQEGWYTPTGGIWQTVYLEARPATYVSSLRCRPEVASGSAEFEIGLRSASGAGWARVTVSSRGQRFAPASARAELRAGAGRARLTVRLDEPKLWHPDAPHLYPAIVAVEAADGSRDHVHTYFALRSVARGRWAGRPYEYLLLNGEPIYLRAALEEGFNPAGIYTAPADAFLRRDLQIAKRCGLNALRLHVKVDEPRRLYWADKLGLLLLADLPAYGAHPPRDGRRCNWEQTWLAALRRDRLHPALIGWVLFNETWGIGHGPRWDGWIAELYRRTKQLDPTRLCEDNSACNGDHLVTDLNSWHFHINDYQQARRHIREVVERTYPGSQFNFLPGRRQAGQPLLSSEYGGVAAGAGEADISWCLKYLTNELRRYAKICGYVYTGLTDVEWEHNGLVNYDRTAKEFGYGEFCPGMSVADVFGADFIVMDSAPCPRRRPGQRLRVPLRFSHFGRRPVPRAVLRWQLDGVDGQGRERRGLAAGRCRFAPQHFGLVELPPIEITLPAQPLLASLWCRVETPDGRVLARNYINVDVCDGPLPRVEAPDARTLLIRWDPPLEEVCWPPPATAPAAEKRWVAPAGQISYRLSWPPGLAPDQVERISFIGELAARAGAAKYDWPGPKGNHGYPQTQERKFPSDVELLLGGSRVASFTLPDDPADARGVLSHLAGSEPGSYGYLKRITIDGRRLKAALAGGRVLELTFRVPPAAANRHGLAIFGDRLGRYPVDPTLMIRTRRPHGIDPRSLAGAGRLRTTRPVRPCRGSAPSGGRRRPSRSLRGRS